MQVREAGGGGGALGAQMLCWRPWVGAEGLGNNSPHPCGISCRRGFGEQRCSPQPWGRSPHCPACGKCSLRKGGSRVLCPVCSGTSFSGLLTALGVTSHLHSGHIAPCKIILKLIIRDSLDNSDLLFYFLLHNQYLLLVKKMFLCLTHARGCSSCLPLLPELTISWPLD